MFQMCNIFIYFMLMRTGFAVLTNNEGNVASPDLTVQFGNVAGVVSCILLADVGQQQRNVSSAHFLMEERGSVSKVLVLKTWIILPMSVDVHMGFVAFPLHC